MDKGKVFVISAPAGTGKTTLTHMMVDAHENVVQSLSYTTRLPREGEVSGIHYQFVTRPEFEQKIAQEEFLEHAEIYGNYYGTSKKWVQKRLDEGRNVILVIDTQGALQLMGKYPATFIFIKPPNFVELRRRLLERRTESDEIIDRRVGWAEKEIQKAELYDYVIVNNDLNEAFKELEKIICK
jgi:guanylate kinase